ncbi:contractile injection system tape measure protein [uncultured Tenacibaculum sp.]|uniref:contractile injection system tape measure protein n=1 Tax=uncultured Tenacibaculum sp. TaxID=174713 RepID=UPI0026346680|nr:contractile injection system tape measure protein [uncultured Tenacibaculum sp.]
MKNEQTHIIKSQQYQIELDDASKSYAYQSRISKLQEHSIQHILEKVMDKFHSPKYLDQYDEITLDLGTITAGNFDREIGYKIEEALESFFKKNIHGGNLVKGKRKSIDKSYANQFLYFLRNGYLQWDVPSSKNPVLLLSEALKEDREALTEALKNEGKKEYIRRRMISQLEDPYLEEIVLAIKNDEGVFINQSRNDITNYQKQYHLVDTHQSYFRDALWEIILAYIFTEVTGYTNQKHFLKYLTRKVAAKYNLSYKVLLEKLSAGLQTKQVNTIPNFDRIIFELQEEITGQTVIVDSKESIVFTEVFLYFLAHKSLPIHAKITSLTLFVKELNVLIKEQPTFFYTNFYAFIERDDRHINFFEKFFGEKLLNAIVEEATNEVAHTAFAFFKALKNISVTKSKPSETITLLENNIGRIIFRTYVVTKQYTSNTIEEFLFQIVQNFTLDATFIEILELYNSKSSSIQKQTAAHIFLEEIHTENITRQTTQTSEISFTTVATKLYAYYTKRNVISFEVFQEGILKKDVKMTSLKLIITLLEVYSKNRSVSKFTLENWLEQRLSEIQIKGENSNSIITELLDLIQFIDTDKKLEEVLVRVENIFKNQEGNTTINKAENIAITEEKALVQIPSYAYNELLLSIKKALFNRTNNSLEAEVKKILQIFSKKYTIKEEAILFEVQKHIAIAKIPQFVLEILKRIQFNKNQSNTVYEEELKEQYALDVVEFYFNSGKLPWWFKSTTISSVQEFIDLVLHTQPKKLEVWFKRSQYQSTIVHTISEETFVTLIKVLNTSVSNTVFQLEKVFHTILYKDIASISTITLQQKKELKLLFLSYVLKNPIIKIEAFTAYFVETFSNNFSIAKSDIYHFVLERIKNDTTTFSLLQQLQKQITKKVSISSEIYTKEFQKIMQSTSWKSVVDTTENEVLIQLVTNVYKNQPQELKFYLKKVSFREALLEKLTIKQHKELITILFSTVSHQELQIVFETFKKIRKLLDTSNYLTIWNRFVNSVLLQIAIKGTINWSIKDWSLLVFNSFSSIQKSVTVSKVEIIRQVIITNSDFSKKINEDLLILSKAEDEILEKEARSYTPFEVERQFNMDEAVFIENAGMIILGPYIPMLFSRMGLTENREFKDDFSRQKGMFALQYAVTGTTKVDEHILLLNKIICGVDIYEPLRQEVTLADEEKELIDSMLQAIIQQWSTLGNTSVEGLRVSFLARSGSVIEEEKKFVLMVEQQTFDMLLDHIPWTIGQLKLNWMPKLLETIWRQ